MAHRKHPAATLLNQTPHMVKPNQMAIMGQPSPNMMGTKGGHATHGKKKGGKKKGY